MQVVTILVVGLIFRQGASFMSYLPNRRSWQNTKSQTLAVPNMIAVSDLAGTYGALLEAHPVVVKSVTAGIIAACGDAVAQRSEMCGADAKKFWHWRRSLAAFADGLLLSGPALHFGYAFLDHLKLNAWWCVVVDEFICDPMSTITYLVATSIFESKPLVPLFREKFWPAMLGGLSTSLVFIPVQYISFRYGPESWRVFVVNICDFFWTCIVSRQSHKRQQQRQQQQLGTGGEKVHAS